MKIVAKVLSLLTSIVIAARAQVTPLTEPLTEEKEVTITCELTQLPKKTEVVVFNSAKDGDAAKGVYHYKLWIPKGYNADQQKRWPCMFIMSPGGNAAMGNMAGYLKANGYVVVMLVESKNGPWGPIVGNFLAAHDDVVKRARIAEGQKFATGMSGGARGSSVFVQARPGFAGLILQGAGPSFDEKNGYNVSGIKRDPKMVVAMTMGVTDSNKSEVARTDAVLSKARFRSFEFPGGHTWAPAEVFEQAMAWIKEKTGERPSGLIR